MPSKNELFKNLLLRRSQLLGSKTQQSVPGYGGRFKPYLAARAFGTKRPPR